MAAGMEVMAGGDTSANVAANTADAAAAAIQAIAAATLQVEKESRAAAAQATESMAAAPATSSEDGASGGGGGGGSSGSLSIDVAKLQAENTTLKASVERLTAEAAKAEEKLKALGADETARAEKFARLESEVSDLHKQLAATKLEGAEALDAQKKALETASALNGAAGGGDDKLAGLTEELMQTKAEADAQQRLMASQLEAKNSDVDKLTVSKRLDESTTEATEAPPPVFCAAH